MTRRLKVLLTVNALALAIFVYFSVWSATKIDWAAVGRSLAGAGTGYELAMAASWLAVLFLRPLRLMTLIGVMSPDSPRRYGAVWSAVVVAMGLNAIVPLRAGELAMGFMLYKNLGIRVPRVVSALVVDRFFDLATVMALFVGSLSVVPVAANWTAGLLPSTLIVLSGLVVGLWLLVHLRATWLRLIHWALAKMAPRYQARLVGQAEELFSSLAGIDKPTVLFKITTLSVLIWMTTISSYWFGILATWPSASLAAAAFTTTVVALAFVVPVTPAGVGIFHGTCVLALSVFDVPFEPALAFAIVAHALQVLSVLALGAIALLSQGLSLRSVLTATDSAIGPAVAKKG